MLAKRIHIWLFLLSFTGWAQSVPLPSEAVFVKNNGQWAGSFSHQLRINGGAFFFEETGYSLVLHHPTKHEHAHNHPHGVCHHNRSFALKMRWQNAKLPYVEAEKTLKHTHHYLLGNDPARWKQHVPLSKDLVYFNLYDGIHVKYFGNGPHLEYDIEVEPGADPDQLAFLFKGPEHVQLRGDRLLIKTPFGDLVERIPLAYQEINGVKYEVSCRYQMKGDTVSFKLGRYDPNHTLIIDPLLEFSTLTGSSADNFGFTATYDNAGNMYAAGIVMGTGYPTTTGVLQNTYSGGRTDIGVTKFDPSGSQVLYSTYIGGSELDLPHSMVCDLNGKLFMLGSTGSSDFPVTANAYQSSFAGGPLGGTGWEFTSGADIFVLQLSGDGSDLLGSTFLGGNQIDGANTGIYRNYGDDARGEIVLDAQNNVYIASSTNSTNLLLNGTSTSVMGGQDALIASFTPDMRTLRWGKLLGGTAPDVGYSLKLDRNNKLFVTGSTQSVDLDLGANSGVAFAQRKNGYDGFVYRLNAASGQIERGSYIGGSGYDQSFFVTLDRNDNVYLYGQSLSGLSVSAGVYSNAGSRQFICRLNNDLTAFDFYTLVGSGQQKFDLVPTAFLVDDCFKIYISGWNGTSNRAGVGGNTYNLPVTGDAFQSTTDGSDFYFMVLDRNASDLIYGSYFGGTSGEHVDGGTSRFDPRGVIYQAICAACGQLGFPTTPGAYSEINGSNNCNLGAVKFDFQSTVRAIPLIDYTSDVDTVCNTLFVDFTNNSINAHEYEWDFGNGQSSTQEEPTASFNGFGTYTIQLIAHDTICDLYDTATVTLLHNLGADPKASFEVDYADCDKTFKASFINNSQGSSAYQWDFGDGSSSTLAEPEHYFPGIGTYTITLTAIDTLCFNTDTYSLDIEFTDTIPPPQANVHASPCLDGSLKITVINGQPWYQYRWEDETGRSFSGENPRIVFSESGFHDIVFTVIDTLCNATYADDYVVRIGAIQNEVFVPNAFTPNADGKNEKFIVYGNHCTLNDHFTIYNRWGQIVFETYEPYTEFWDALIDGKPANEDVFIYTLRRGDEVQRGTITLIR